MAEGGRERGPGRGVGSGRGGLGARQRRGCPRAHPGIGLGEKPVMWIEGGRQPLGNGRGFTEGEAVSDLRDELDQREAEELRAGLLLTLATRTRSSRAARAR